jgi:hypothetical protein
MATALAVVAGLGALAACGDDDDDGESRLGVEELRVGICFDEPIAAEVIDEVTPVPCNGPHLYEVFATFDLPLPVGEAYPGSPNVDVAARAGCEQAATAPPPEEFDIFALAPTEDGWDEGDRAVTCAAILRSGEPAQTPLVASS